MQDRLTLAGKHVALAEEQCHRQARVIEELRAQGRDVRGAEALLAQMLRTRDQMQAHWQVMQVAALRERS